MNTPAESDAAEASNAIPCMGVIIRSRLPWRQETHTVRIPAKATVRDALDAANFAESPEACFFVVSGKACASDTQLCPDDEIMIFPVMAGG